MPRRAVGGAEFFQRHPVLHPFLLAELRAAAAALESRRVQLHPSLFPTLLLLSRLKCVPIPCIAPLADAEQSNSSTPCDNSSSCCSCKFSNVCTLLSSYACNFLFPECSGSTK